MIYTTMGIPFYYKSLIRKYNYIETNVIPQNIDYFFIDYNGIIHPVAHTSVCIDNDEKSFLNLLWKKTKDIIHDVSPHTSYIMIDGVAPLAKVAQQRKRRYLSNKNTLWDTNAITSGTPFMQKLENYIRDQCSTLENVLLNGSDISGEGEHKIFEMLNTINNSTVVIHGLDADLIMLSLLSTEINETNDIYLMREQNGESITYISVKRLYSAIKTEWSDIFENNTIYSYCVVMSLLGNDFIPHPLSLNLKNNGMKILMNACKNIEQEIFESSDCININYESIKAILKNLLNHEDIYMKE